MRAHETGESEGTATDKETIDSRWSEQTSTNTTQTRTRTLTIADEDEDGDEREKE